MLRLPQRAFERIVAAINALSIDHRPRGSKKLQSRVPVWRIRIGDYRVMYTIADADKLISIDNVERRTTTTY
jgi:mRNA interferase RelE/StbE